MYICVVNMTKQINQTNMKQINETILNVLIPVLFFSAIFIINFLNY
jgi:hypothetical protein